MERVMGIEPTRSAWKADVLPLNYTRALNCTRAALIGTNPQQNSRTQENHTRMPLIPRTSPFAADESANFGAKPRDTHAGWWGEADSNRRRQSQRIYSPSRLTASVSPRRNSCDAHHA